MYIFYFRAPERADERVAGCVALNVAMFAAVLLASRLDTSNEVGLIYLKLCIKFDTGYIQDDFFYFDLIL
jgi:hypothetical protein